jgi:carbon catabolite-derepressing protein kinase
MKALMGSKAVVQADFLTANLSDDKGQLLFQAPSPPAWNDGIKLDTTMPSNPSPTDSPTPLRPANSPSPLMEAVSPRSTSSIATDRSTRPYISKIGILPSSLPHHHLDYVARKKAGKVEGTPLSATHSEEKEPHPQSEAEKAETARRLNPHSKSQLKLDEASQKPAGMTPVPQKKAKPVKWQFGIRSRNQPLEAIGCIFRALQKLGATWADPDPFYPPFPRRKSREEDIEYVFLVSFWHC